jgi:glycosyltransferase involved in cell wall biosynthesis
MERALTSHDRERMGDRARASVLEHYSVPRVARNYLELFNELLPGRVTPVHEPNAATAQKTT